MLINEASSDNPFDDHQEAAAITKLETIDDIRRALLELMAVKDSIADDVAAIRVCQNSLERLVDRFYQETHEILAYRQYQAAKNDPEYFMQLVAAAYRHYEEEAKEKIFH